MHFSKCIEGPFKVCVSVFVCKLVTIFFFSSTSLKTKSLARLLALSQAHMRIFFLSTLYIFYSIENTEDGTMKNHTQQ